MFEGILKKKNAIFVKDLLVLFVVFIFFIFLISAQVQLNVQSE